MNNRLRKICDFVEKNSIVADIGTDHGIVPIYLSESGISKKIIATDISANSLSKLDEKLIYNDSIKNIETRVSDGLDCILEYEVDTLIISGMGGILVKNILEKNLKVAKSIRTLILSPNNSLDLLRKFLYDNGFCIVDEEDVFENGKYYQILKVKLGKDFYNNEIEYIFGKHILSKKSSNLYEFLDKEYKKYKNIVLGIEMNSHNKERILELNEKIELMGSILNDLR